MQTDLLLGLTYVSSLGWTKEGLNSDVIYVPYSERVLSLTNGVYKFKYSYKC